MTNVLLGVDAGGTRSTAVIADERGAWLGRADGGPANYQSVGVAAARETLQDLVARALHAAQVPTSAIAAACYGIAGGDRPKDFEAIAGLLPEVGPLERRVLFNDCELVRRAGAPLGVGIGVVSGTGTNVIGCGPRGEHARVGGLCYELGDFGSAGEIGLEALRLAMRGKDGRGKPTALYPRLCAELGVDPLEDIIDLWMRDDPAAKNYGRLAPAVFETAAAGDEVALTLLEHTGRELALAASVVAGRLFTPEDAPTVVLGGSVLQKGKCSRLVDSFAGAFRATYPKARVVRLLCEPVVGAVLTARDRLYGAPSDEPSGEGDERIVIVA